MPSANLVEFELGEPARAYIMRELASGSSFAKILRACLPHDSGRLYGYFPQGSQFSEPDDFIRSPFLTKGIRLGGEAQRRAQEVILQAMARDPRSCFLLETLRSRTDPPSTHPHIVHRDEVYFFMTGEDSDASRLHTLFHSGRDYPFVAATATVPKSSSMPVSGMSVREDYLRTLAENTSLLFIGACDAEGYNVIWSRAT